MLINKTFLRNFKDKLIYYQKNTDQSNIFEIRCHTINIDPYNPKIELSQIQKISLSNFTNEFSNKFEINDNFISEEESIANTVINYISKNNL